MCTLRIQHSLFFLPSLFFDGFAWILILCLIIDSRGFKKGTPDFKELTAFDGFDTTKQSPFSFPIPWAFFGNLNPQNFHPRQIFMWQHDGLAIPYCCRFNRGPGKNALKRPDKTEIFYSKMMRVNWRSKMCKNHQITGFQSHHKSIIFPRSLLMFNEFWGSGNEQENWFLELQTYKEIAFAIKSFTL